MLTKSCRRFRLICDRPLPNSFFVLEEANVHLDILSSQITEIEFEIATIARVDRMGSDCNITNSAGSSRSSHAAYTGTEPQEMAADTTWKLDKARQDIRAWMDAFAHIPVTDENEMEHRLTSIFCFYVWFRIETCDYTDEMGVDHFQQQFDYIVSLAESYICDLKDSSESVTNVPRGTKNTTSLFPGLTMGTGLVTCICLIITKCRDSSLRQRCMQVLQTIGPSGSFYGYDIIARMQAVIGKEELNLK